MVKKRVIKKFVFQLLLYRIDRKKRKELQNRFEQKSQPVLPVGIIDYGMGNLQSVEKAFESLSCKVERLFSPPNHYNFLAIVLPGVGAFGDGIKGLEAKGFLPFLENWISKDLPFLGICLGYQLLFEESLESKGAKGIGIFKGKVVRFPESKEKVPHIGWNSVEVLKKSAYLDGISSGDYFYFVHSYYPEVIQKEIILLQTTYCVPFASAIARGNLLATQFHPEKSHKKGIQLLKNFLIHSTIHRPLLSI